MYALVSVNVMFKSTVSLSCFYLVSKVFSGLIQLKSATVLE